MSTNGIIGAAKGAFFIPPKQERHHFPDFHPGVELAVTEQPVPCADCRERWNTGKADNPFHPACIAHLRALR